MVTTKATAPGGARTEKVGLPFDPDLFDHMVEHGVVIEVSLCMLFLLCCIIVATTSCRNVYSWLQHQLCQALTMYVSDVVDADWTGN